LISVDPDSFEAWWHDTGSGLPPLGGEELCIFAERIARKAWEARPVVLDVQSIDLEAWAERFELDDPGDARSHMLDHLRDVFLNYVESLELDYYGTSRVAAAGSVDVSRTGGVDR
jgi:hypothetical protein